MKKIAVSLLVGGLALLGLTPMASATNDPKVYVCHWANGNPHVIHIAQSGLNGHFEANGTPKNVPGHKFDVNLGTNLSDAEEEACENQDLPDNPGPQGPAGPAGPTGPQGPAGPAGENGGPGSDGEDGENGKDGLTPVPVCITALGGVYFVFGEVELPAGHVLISIETPCTAVGGPAGPAGADGTNGTNGVDGLNGKDGPAGSNGSNGTNSTVAGPAGAAGVNGESGPAGPAGANGEAPEAPAGPAPTELPKTGGFTDVLLILGGLVLASGLVALALGKLLGRRI